MDDPAFNSKAPGKDRKGKEMARLDGGKLSSELQMQHFSG
jgi:hypothetical protein